jgi:hypothetical protein
MDVAGSSMSVPRHSGIDGLLRHPILSHLLFGLPALLSPLHLSNRVPFSAVIIRHHPPHSEYETTLRSIRILRSKSMATSNKMGDLQTIGHKLKCCHLNGLPICLWKGDFSTNRPPSYLGLRLLIIWEGLIQPFSSNPAMNVSCAVSESP